MAITPIADCNQGFTCAKLAQMINEMNATANAMNLAAGRAEQAKVAAEEDMNNAKQARGLAVQARNEAVQARNETYLAQNLAIPEGTIKTYVIEATAGQLDYNITNKSVVLVMTGTGSVIKYTNTDTVITLDGNDFTPSAGDIIVITVVK